MSSPSSQKVPSNVGRWWGDAMMGHLLLIFLKQHDWKKESKSSNQGKRPLQKEGCLRPLLPSYCGERGRWRAGSVDWLVRGGGVEEADVMVGSPKVRMRANWKTHQSIRKLGSQEEQIKWLPNGNNEGGRKGKEQRASRWLSGDSRTRV